jgi:hypothetical protein
MKCNEIQGKWCKNKHGASKIIDTLETYHGSRVEQSGVCDVGDKIPPHAIRIMGVGHLIPIKEHLLVEGK